MKRRHLAPFLLGVSMTMVQVVTVMMFAAFVVWLLNQIELGAAIAGTVAAFWIVLLSYWAFAYG
jgi:hypothetical protein